MTTEIKKKKIYLILQHKCLKTNSKYLLWNLLLDYRSLAYEKKWINNTKHQTYEDTDK